KHVQASLVPRLRLFFKVSPPLLICTRSLHDALPIFFSPSRRPPRARAPLCLAPLCARVSSLHQSLRARARDAVRIPRGARAPARSEEHTSELQSHLNLVCRLLLEKKKLNRRTAAPDR